MDVSYIKLLKKLNETQFLLKHCYDRLQEQHEEKILVNYVGLAWSYLKITHETHKDKIYDKNRLAKAVLTDIFELTTFSPTTVKHFASIFHYLIKEREMDDSEKDWVNFLSVIVQKEEITPDMVALKPYFEFKKLPQKERRTWYRMGKYYFNIFEKPHPGVEFNLTREILPLLYRELTFLTEQDLFVMPVKLGLIQAKHKLQDALLTTELS